MPSANSSKPAVVRVGVGVVVVDPLDPSRIFCGIRKGSHGAGSLALPGGHLEMYESWEDCAIREVQEEMNVELDNLQFIHVTNNPMPDEGKHYVTIFMAGSCVNPNARPVNAEPEKCEGWKSYTIEELHSQMQILFGPLKQLVHDRPSALFQFLAKNASSRNS